MAATWEIPDPREFDSLLDVLDDSATRWAGKRQFALRTDDGIEVPWTAEDLRYRSKLAAWRLRRLGLNPGDRLLTWSPSTPALPAVYYGAMRAGLVVVPLDLRMTPDVIKRIADGRTPNGSPSAPAWTRPIRTRPGWTTSQSEPSSGSRPTRPSERERAKTRAGWTTPSHRTGKLSSTHGRGQLATTCSR